MSRAFMKKRNTFRPTDIGGCTLWLDGADVTTTSMTFSSGSNLSVWKDKSGSSNHFSLTSGTPASITDGGYRVVSIPSGAIMTSANQITFTTSSAFFIVSKLLTINPISANINMLLGFTNIPSDTTGDFSIRFYQGVLQGSSTPGNPGNHGDLGNGKYYVNGSFNPNFDTTYYMNSYSIIDTVAPTKGGTSYVTISSTINDRPFIGNVAEFIYYSGGVTDSQRQQVEAYLSQKWGLRQQIPQSHPGTTGIVYSQQSIPKALYTRYQNIFTPTSIGGCQIWMDAADITSFTFSSGSNISVWKDKSGYSNNFTTVSGTNTRIADGGYSVVSFSNGNYMTSANQVNLTTSSALFIVCKVLNTGFNMILACTNITSGGNLGDFSIRAISGVLYGTANFNNGDDFGNQNYYVNGTFNPAFGSSTYVNIYSIIDTLVPGKSGTTYLTFSSPFFSRYLNGNIAEFIFYPGGVSNPDRQQIEGYLAWKWGLQGSLDSSNSYKNSSPSTTNPAGISRPVGLPVRSNASIATPNTRLFTVTFTYSALGNQTFQVPAAIFPVKLTVYIWGAGGGGTTGTSRPTNYGGAGAYIQGILTVTPGETLGIIVGQGGIAITSNGAAAATTYGGGGGVPSGGNSTQNSSGGGRSAIQRAAADIVTAGAGGGSGMTNTGANPTNPVAYTLAGGAAAWTGTASAGDYPSSSSYAGQGGTTSGGGLSGNKALGNAAAAANGSQYTGGSAGQYGGGGGGGYYGGGGGTDDGGWGHGGGGGSSYTNLLANPTGSNSTNGYSAPNTSSPYYQSNVGAGGTTGVGGNGLIVLTYYA